MASWRMLLLYSGTISRRMYQACHFRCFAVLTCRSAQQWPYTVQNVEGYAPSPCEFDAVRQAVIEACDGLDGLVDGIISAPALCTFEAQSLVGKSFTCDADGNGHTFSQQLATVIDKIWQGAQTSQGQFLWYGMARGANFTTTITPNLPNSSVAQPFLISDSWFKGFLAKDLSFDTANVSYAEFADLFLQGHIQYDSIIGDASPDLRPFKARGGKMITWQGLAVSTLNLTKTANSGIDIINRTVSLILKAPCSTIKRLLLSIQPSQTSTACFFRLGSGTAEAALASYPLIPSAS